MRKRITMLILAAMLALTMAFGGAGAAFAAPCGPEAGRGCFEEDNPDKSNPKFVIYERGQGEGGGADKQDCSVNPSAKKCR